MNTNSDRLPSGFVTFVFTDIEGSTPMLKRLGDDYAAVGEQHDALLIDAFESHGGQIVNTAGDSMFAAFPDTNQALRACRAAQSAISGHTWPHDEIVKVRMGVHAGLARPRNGNYVAMAVNQAARVMSAAHGRQILVTQTVVDRLDDEESPSVEPVGKFRLRDFDEPPALYQTTDWAIAGTSPVRATPTQGHNIVVPANEFFDRRRETADIRRRLVPGSVVSMVGPGGVGKSRLAREVGMSIADDWTDGVWVAELEDIDDESLVVERIADVVAVAGRDSTERLDDIVNRLRSRSTVVIYDGSERHIDVCAEVIERIQRECPGVAQLATGREPLHLPGEARITIAPLPLPSERITDVDTLREVDVMKLFLDRAALVRPDLTFESHALRSIAKICQHLDGLPLAIEIAAARVDVMTVDEIVDALDDQFRLLRTRDRALPARQRTMKGLLDWSTQLLSDDEQRALRRLAIFTGAFGLNDAEPAVADEELAADDVQELIWSLVEKSLVVADTSQRPTTYRLLETVQQYGRRLLREHDEELDVARRVAHWFESEMGPDHVVDRRWINFVHAAQSNVRAVITTITDDRPELAQRLACSIGRFHEAVHAWKPGIEELGRYVDELAAPTPARVAMLTALADLWLQTGAVDEAEALADEARILQSTAGTPEWDDAGLERTLGDIAVRTGRLDDAETIARAALGNDLTKRGKARMWNLLGIAVVSAGDPTSGFDPFDRELAIYVDLGIDGKVASAHGNVAECALRAGDRRLAAEHQAHCLELALMLGQPVLLAYSSIVAARLAADDGAWSTAVALQCSSDEALAEIGHIMYGADEGASTELLSAASQILSKTEFDHAKSFGLGLDQITAAELADEVFQAILAGSGATTGGMHR